MEEITLEKIDLVRDRTGLSYKDARDLLERSQGNVIEALIESESKKQTRWTEEFSVRSSEVIEKVKEILRAGNVNKIRVKNEGQTLVEIPIALGAIGAVALPSIAALGVMVALFKRCTIEVVRNDGSDDTTDKKDDIDIGDHQENSGL